MSRGLAAAGHTPIPVGRGPGWDPATGVCHPSLLDGVEAVVHLAGESIGGRWTAAKKSEILRSRVEGTGLIARVVAQVRPAVLVSGSAIGFYGDRGAEVLTEESGPGTGFLAEVVQAWESATRPAAAAGVRTVCIRTGLVLDRAGGSLPRMLLPFRLGLGGPIGPGTQYWSWITLEDEVRAIMHCLSEPTLEGPVNLTAPDPVPNSDFVKALGRALHRPAVLPLPSFGLRALLGREMADSLLLGGQRVVPARLQATGFDFAHPALDEALQAVLAES